MCPSYLLVHAQSREIVEWWTTAYLDVKSERRINEHLRGLDLTRISVAHRPEIMSGADCVIRIDANGASEVNKEALLGTGTD